MARLQLAEAIETMRGELLAGSIDGSFEGAAIDSRQVRGGELFFAFSGARADGHEFVGEVARRGARGAVVTRPVGAPPGGAPQFAVIRVGDAEGALQALAARARQRVPRRLVAVTGSAGKTTTKELLARLLARRYRTAASPGNRNNLLGFPLALLGIADDTEWMVAELGMSVPGELRRLSELSRPDVVLFTNVRAVHLEGFERPGHEATLRDVAEAKAELLAGLRPGGLVVANAADAEVVRIAERHVAGGGTVAWFALDGDAALHRPRLRVERLEVGVLAEDSSGELRASSRFTLRDTATGEDVGIELPLHGRVQVENFLAAATTALELGVPLRELPAALAGLESGKGRGRVVRLAGGALLVDDCYNSNPDALQRALEAAAALPAARRWAVLGDMRELGRHGAEHHRRLGRAAARLGFSPVLGVGALARELVAAAAEQGAAVAAFDGAAEAAERAAAEVRAGDVVLVKGSRGVSLEVVVDRLLGAGAAS